MELIFEGKDHRILSKCSAGPILAISMDIHLLKEASDSSMISLRLLSLEKKVWSFQLTQITPGIIYVLESNTGLLVSASVENQTTVLNNSQVQVIFISCME